MFRKLMFAAALAVPAAAQAGPTATYDVVSDFGSSVFSYGLGTGGTNFTALPGPGTECFGVTGFTCFQTGPYAHPVIGMNTTGADIFTGTVWIPTNTLYLHPADGAGDKDAIVRFIAPTASTYRLTGLVQREDVTEGGDGIVFTIFGNTGGSATSLTSFEVPKTTYGSSTSFGALDVFLQAGESVDFVVNNRNFNHGFDSTGLSATIAAVPEPAEWALMIGGLGLVGGALRSRRRIAAHA